MRRVSARSWLFQERSILRVTDLASMASGWAPDLRFLVQTRDVADLYSLQNMAKGGARNIAVLTSSPELQSISTLPSVLAPENSLHIGDVVAITPQRSDLQVLYRESDMHHTVFLTNRCNSNCLMCSQPPTSHDDSWLVTEAELVAMHIRNTPETIGFTGGEPLLLEAELRALLDIYSRAHPGVQSEVLTNGRLFSDPKLAHDILAGLSHPVTWLVPLYGHADFLHDFVVQVPGAFDQTISGLLTLQSFRQPIQLRIVLIEPVVRILPDLCEFIGRNLPFVREVALMGCEPTGFALANREICNIDLRDWKTAIEAGVHRLRRLGMPVVLMNTPLCALSPHLWQYAHQSISDWKRTFAPECDECIVKGRCAGLFASHEKGWRPTRIIPFREGMADEAL